MPVHFIPPEGSGSGWWLFSIRPRKENDIITRGRQITPQEPSTHEAMATPLAQYNNNCKAPGGMERRRGDAKGELVSLSTGAITVQIVNKNVHFKGDDGRNRKCNFNRETGTEGRKDKRKNIGDGFK